MVAAAHFSVPEAANWMRSWPDCVAISAAVLLARFRWGMWSMASLTLFLAAHS